MLKQYGILLWGLIVLFVSCSNQTPTQSKESSSIKEYKASTGMDDTLSLLTYNIAVGFDVQELAFESNKDTLISVTRKLFKDLMTSQPQTRRAPRGEPHALGRGDTVDRLRPTP